MFRTVTHERTANPDIIVKAIYDGESAPVVWEPEVAESVQRKGFSSRIGDLAESYPTGSVRTLVLGLGKRSDLTSATFRKAAGTLGKRLSYNRMSNVHLDLGDLPDASRLGQIMGETLGLMGWSFGEFKGTATKEPDFADLNVCSLDEKFDEGLSKGIALSASINLARTLVATPPNVATPGWMAGQAGKLEALGIGSTVFRGADLERERFEGLINVGKASANEPCMVRMEYRPLSTTEQRPVVLIGKTITYDTGGLAIKTKDGMRGMKADKAGGCAVLAAMHAIATVIKPNFPVIGLLVAAENSISDNAFRNDDILTYRNGVTVEVTNTDAEGRLVLADGLCWACEKENPRCIIDLATLTGGVVIALGSVFAGLFANDDGLANTLIAEGEASGEKVWRLPLHPDYRAMMKSEVADLVNSAASRGAHPVAGAIFLSYFVKEDIPWAHIDIAGVATADRGDGVCVPGPTGFGVRLLTSYLESLG